MRLLLSSPSGLPSRADKQLRRIIDFAIRDSPLDIRTGTGALALPFAKTRSTRYRSRYCQKMSDNNPDTPGALAEEVPKVMLMKKPVLQVNMDSRPRNVCRMSGHRRPGISAH